MSRWRVRMEAGCGYLLLLGVLLAVLLAAYQVLELITLAAGGLG